MSKLDFSLSSTSEFSSIAYLALVFLDQNKSQPVLQGFGFRAALQALDMTDIYSYSSDKTWRLIDLIDGFDELAGKINAIGCANFLAMTNQEKTDVAITALFAMHENQGRKETGMKR